ncbi:prolactin-releasing peptide receptor [Diorhabda carinulata]|uniref:prolactin-releasing peptide receptor n=1 Tax=Diorhabda carinulata TaxID=1163345 RepID=UPI0025A1E3B7|nr:prolactin-releasing peptide receptor [Diorhabda carinulata]
MSRVENGTNPMDHMPPDIWEILQSLILGINETDLDLRKPHLKTVFTYSYPYIIFFYGALICVGVIGNLYMCGYIVNKKLYKDETYSFLLNNAISDIFKCVIVLPLSLYVLLIRNWVLGELLCSFLPMIQDIPQHTSTLTFILLAWDRYRYIKKPLRPRLPAFVCNVGTWLTSGCLVLPYPMYIMYIDLGQVYPKLEAVQGVGLCTVNLLDDIKEYTRGIFIIMYAAPLTTISCLFIRVSRELSKQNPAAAIKFEARAKENKTRIQDGSQSGIVEVQSIRTDYDRSSQYSRGSFRDFDTARTLYEFREPDLNVIKERRTQKFLVTIVVLYGISLCPLMVMKIARLAIVETYENMGYFDVVYIIFVWVAFLPACSTPLLFITWKLNSSSVERIRGYLRLSSRKMRHSSETVTTLTGTPASNQGKRCQYAEEAFSDTNSCQQDLPST